MKNKLPYVYGAVAFGAVLLLGLVVAFRSEGTAPMAILPDGQKKPLAGLIETANAVAKMDRELGNEMEVVRAMAGVKNSEWSSLSIMALATSGSIEDVRRIGDQICRGEISAEVATYAVGGLSTRQGSEATEVLTRCAQQAPDAEVRRVAQTALENRAMLEAYKARQ